MYSNKFGLFDIVEESTDVVIGPPFPSSLSNPNPVTCHPPSLPGDTQLRVTEVDVEETSVGGKTE